MDETKTKDKAPTIDLSIKPQPVVEASSTETKKARVVVVTMS
jgi:hypothetical protein